MKVKSYQELLDEATLKNNPGIPGSGDDSDDSEDYLAKIETRARERLEALSRRHGQDIPRFMSLVAKARSIQAGHEKELEKLAEESIRSLYGSILDGVNLDIKFPKPGEIEKSMEKVKPEPPEMPQLELLQDEKIISEIQKRKIANNITQGEAKNTKLCLNLAEVRDGLIRILGREQGMEYKELLNKITDIAGFFDWQIPMEVQLEMWKANKSGFSGSVRVEWESEENGDSEELAQDILKDLEKDPELPTEETIELFAETGPTIHALGTDFAMLLHETVKGIYELIAAAAIPEDPEEAETIIMNTDTLADEIEDLRYGPEIAGDLRDFVNSFPESSDIENLREHFFGKMMGLEAGEFLNFMYMILNQDPKARKMAQDLINEIKEELNRYELGQAGIDSGEEEIEMPSRAPKAEEVIDYSELSKREIEKLIDDALDKGDYEKVKVLSQYLKESKRMEVFERLDKIMGDSE